ncbi:exodeoxyribonuclease VII large subunit [Marinitoga aeolica]|uniref:Exodeoxyribonuclease 7 large subunit n=1 Tax=Marinitoga aeolica TaxID=2809031 RepID=A0ABY8PQ52_9BACT|nr:exodeoxyribonuclease VII large subunit [Marinitoga aeolica]WGS64776.1 exodeoxyribonuclease VII large subunit [Marinitoga aeolica]
MKKFKDLLDLVKWITNELEKTSILDDTIVFSGDISKAKTSSSGDLYIEISQRNDNGKTYKITVFLSRYYIKTLLDNLKLKNIFELENKKWIVIGKLSFWPSSSSFAIKLQSLLPSGESNLEKRKREILNKLKLEGLIRTKENKLEFLEPIRKIAVISSETAAGYGDFIKNINKLKNPPLIHLYPSPMQGIEVPISISKSLKLIIDSKIDYDVIAIIRGGGAKADLMYFDDYNLAQNIAWVSNNKIPILTGIGHEQDTTIPDFVSYMRFSTPTEVARAIVKQIEYYNKKIDDNFQNIIYSINNIFIQAEFFSKNILNNLSSMIDQFFEEENNKMKLYLNVLTNFSNIIYSNEQNLNKAINSIKFFSNYIGNNLENLEKNNDKIEENLKYFFDNYLSNNLKKLNDYYLNITKNSPFSAFLSGGAVLIQDSQKIDSIYKANMEKNLEIILYDGEMKTEIKEIKHYREEEK